MSQKDESLFSEPPPSEAAIAAAKQASDIAKLSAEVLDLGLVRESRPVFVFDKTLAKEKKGNAERQEKHRKEKEKQGLKLGFVPVDALEKVKELGGGSDGWARYIASLSNSGNDTKEVSSGGVAPAIEQVEVQVEVIKEVFIQKEVPGPIEYRYEIKEIEIEKPMTEEQKKTLYVGEKVRALTGFRRKLVKLLIGI